MLLHSARIRRILGVASASAIVLSQTLVSIPFAGAADTVKVTIVKYLDGVVATIPNASSTAFPMHAIWADTEPLFASGNGNYVLGPVGHNNANSYYATTSDMPLGADYSTYETASPECTLAYPYKLDGYTTGNTLVEAAAAGTGLTVPAFTDLTSDKFIIVWNETCPSGPPACISTDVGLKAYWKFDEGSGSTVIDSSGNGNNGTMVNGAGYSPDVSPTISFADFYSALFSVGSSQSFSAPDSASLDLSTDATVSFWFKRAPGDQVHVSKWDTAGNQRSFVLQVFSDNKIYWNVSGDGAAHTYFMSSSTTTDTGWNHLAGTYDGSSLNVYLNGIAMTGSITGAIPASLFDSNQPVSNVYSGANFNNGQLDDVRLYSRALTADEVGDLASGDCDAIDNPPAPVCGNGDVEIGEACDDNNTNPNDGCSTTCTIDSGFSCSGEPSACTTTCGDGIVAGAETCDDSNTINGDGCSAVCQVEPVTCNGLTPTISVQNGIIVGGPQNGQAYLNALTGTAGDDVIVGTIGLDSIKGMGGHDTICSLAGTDKIEGGAGNDWMNGGAGNDTIDGGTGTDTLIGLTENDTLKGGTGADTLCGGAGSDSVQGGNDGDALDGGPDSDTVKGEAGTDACHRGELYNTCESTSIVALPACSSF